VEVGDDDLGTLEIGQHVAGHQLAALVVAVRVVGLEHSETIANGQAGRNNKEATGKPATLGSPRRVDGLPSDDHGHHGGLPGAGSQLQRQAHELRVRVSVSVGNVVKERLARLPRLRGDLRQPDYGLQRLHLAEEGPNVTELMMPPVLK
jgi:hypothetical protein